MENTYLGDTRLNNQEYKVRGEFVDIENEKFYCIHNYHEMDDFFISVVSDSDHFMFISSNGSLTAGRKDRNNALFPYYTDDKISDYKHNTGSRSIFRIEKNGRTFLWEPFTEISSRVYNIRRNIYKSIYGNKIIFEEINSDLEIVFSYGWYNSDCFGFIKKSIITNTGKQAASIQMLDGICNILPSGIDYLFQNEFSNLSDAYKKNELVENTSLALYMLSSIPVDRAEPSETLKCTTVWSTGSVDSNFLLSEKQLDGFIKGKKLQSEIDIRAARGAYFIYSTMKLATGSSRDWMIIAEVNQDSRDVANLRELIGKASNIKAEIDQDISQGTENLLRLVAASDGLQFSEEELNSARHFSNCLFNIMRGGIYSEGYHIESKDFQLFARNTNPELFIQNITWYNSLPESIMLNKLLEEAKKTGNPDLIRVSYEYLPLTFSRRHGDPSRPWNVFSIETRNADGSKKLNYEGNWRDIFQNWEALNLSFPEYIEGIIIKFLNASTADGYNPYRITRNGIDWEVPDPSTPWAYIGYWGDHQVIYLQKFLEQLEAYNPGKLEKLFKDEIFVYANVPYLIKSYDEVEKDPRNTIRFEQGLNNEIEQKVIKSGADGKLLSDSGGKLYRVNLTEKILVSLLAKISNFIPGAGIWMNTQRPEWNDANNALVGNGVSMVTLYYLRRSLTFWQKLFTGSEPEEIKVSEEVALLFRKIVGILKSSSGIQDGFSDRERWSLTQQLGQAGSEYRQNIYAHAFSGKKNAVSIDELKEFAGIVLKFLDHSILRNRRSDGLYHAYNLISIKEAEIRIRHLYEMLEGQVAVLSSGFLSVKESLEVMDALRKSKLFRPDQYSYILYPDRRLPRFTEKNNIPGQELENSELLSKLSESEDESIILKDDSGFYHFNGSFRNRDILKNALDNLDQDTFGSQIEKEREDILDLYERMFDHQSFTGRSGTFYGYEGLGSIYWHMVSKLLLAVEECFFRGIEEGIERKITDRIKDHYYEIKAGIGLYKSPDIYGAFPTDAYSHTPGGAGVKQPGLTGQVKEDILTRMAELGVHIKNGEILFNISLFNENEFLKKRKEVEYYNVEDKKESIILEKGQLMFTVCQVPIVYSKRGEREQGRADGIRLILKDGKILNLPGNKLDQKSSREIFNRTGSIRIIEFYTGNK